MPSKKYIKPPPDFFFVNLGSEVNEERWRKTHSAASRSHAAYWGGSVEHQPEDKEEFSGEQDNTATSLLCEDRGCISVDNSTPAVDSIPAPAVQRQESYKSSSPRSSRGSSVPLLAGVIGGTESRCAADLSTFELFGQTFVKQFIMCRHEEHSILYSGCRLLSYAHSMALTGLGSKAVLLQLKDHLITQRRAKFSSPEGSLGPRCLTAILALGAPIVCLVTQDMPHSLSIEDYISVSMTADYLCCQESADTAHSALEERSVHQQAIRNLLNCSADSQDLDSLALLQYVFNGLDLSMAIEAANHLDTLLGDVAYLFPATVPCSYCLFPACWVSPLTCKWFEKTPKTIFESKMLLLAGLMHRWLGTFLDRDGHELVPANEALQRRAHLRWAIESFEPVGGASNSELQSMYECCRWASLVLLAVEKLSIPIYQAAKNVRVQPRLTRRLRMTNLLSLWGVHKGLLFWVAAVCYSSTAGQCFPLLCTNIFARFGPEIAMLDWYSEIAIKPLRKLKQFESLCCGLAS